MDTSPLNNDPANLVILDRREHTRLHYSRMKRRWQVGGEGAGGGPLCSRYEYREVARALGRPYSSTRLELARQGGGRAPGTDEALTELSGPLPV